MSGCAFCTADLEPVSAGVVDCLEPTNRARRQKRDESVEDELKDALKSTRDELKGATRPAGGVAGRQQDGPDQP